MATRKEVAELAGVSPTSVSYYINNNGYVSEEKRARISKAIEELNYYPNLIARSLKIKTTNHIVLICNEIRNPYYAELVYKMTHCAYKKGYTMLFCNIIDDPQYIDQICGYQVRGVLIASDKVSPEQINRIADMNIPTVILTNMIWDTINKNVLQIKIDTYSGMREVVKHLVSKGHKRIAYVSSCQSKEQSYYDRKFKGFIDELSSNNIDICEDYILYNITSASDSHKYVKEVMDLDVPPTAYVCCNDAVATGILSLVNEERLRVPEDIAITGFDNSENARLSIPKLTTVDIPVSQLSDIAISMMIDKINNKKTHDIMVSTELVIRKSS